MGRRIYGRINFEGSDSYSDTWISIGDDGWVHVEETGRWYHGSQIQYIEPTEDENPERP